MKAVRFDRYGDVDELDVREVVNPHAAPGQVVVRVRAAAVNPGDVYVLRGLAEQAWALRARLTGRPTDAARRSMTFPAGLGTDVAGEVVEVGEAVTGFRIGDHVLGWSADRVSHAELVAVSADHLVAKPSGISWEVAGSMYVAPMAALAAVNAVAPSPGERVVVSGATGAVGGVAVQLARGRGAQVIGLARAANHPWLHAQGALPVAYGPGEEDRIRAVAGASVDAFIDTYGAGYVDLAARLGTASSRINTVVDFEAGLDERARIDGTNDAGGAAGLRTLVELVAEGALEIPVAATYPLSAARQGYRDLIAQRVRGKVVLVP